MKNKTDLELDVKDLKKEIDGLLDQLVPESIIDGTEGQKHNMLHITLEIKSLRDKIKTIEEIISYEKPQV